MEAAQVEMPSKSTRRHGSEESLLAEIQLPDASGPTFQIDQPDTEATLCEEPSELGQPSGRTARK